MLQLQKMELKAVFAACQQMDKDYHPKVTYILIQKNHHVRLYPTNESESCGNGKNVLPGCVVDSSIVDSNYCTFYLCSHQATQVRKYATCNFYCRVFIIV